MESERKNNPTQGIKPDSEKLLQHSYSDAQTVSFTAIKMICHRQMGMVDPSPTHRASLSPIFYMLNFHDQTVRSLTVKFNDLFHQREVT